jgi:uncharacterized membrane protein
MGILIAALSIIVSLVNLLREPPLRTLSDAWWQVGWNIFAVLISLYNWYLRYTSGGAVVMSSALILSLVVACIFLFTGRKEMELVYRRRFDGPEL